MYGAKAAERKLGRHCCKEMKFPILNLGSIWPFAVPPVTERGSQRASMLVWLAIFLQGYPIGHNPRVTYTTEKKILNFQTLLFRFYVRITPFQLTSTGWAGTSVVQYVHVANIFVQIRHNVRKPSKIKCVPCGKKNFYILIFSIFEHTKRNLILWMLSLLRIK